MSTGTFSQLRPFVKLTTSTVMFFQMMPFVTRLGFTVSSASRQLRVPSVCSFFVGRQCLTAKRFVESSRAGYRTASSVSESPVESRSQEFGNPDVAIFWDAENVRVPKDWSAGLAANAIRSTLSDFGRLIERRYYYDSRKESEQRLDRASFDLGGFVLIDCPTRGKKETLDKKIIVDVMHFAWHSVSSGRPAVVCLISGDGDYAYLLNKVRDIGVNAIIIYPGAATTLPAAFFNSADVVLSWEHDILNAASQGLGEPIMDSTFDAEEKAQQEDEGIEVGWSANISVHEESGPSHLSTGDTNTFDSGVAQAASAAAMTGKYDLLLWVLHELGDGATQRKVTDLYLKKTGVNMKELEGKQAHVRLLTKQAQGLGLLAIHKKIRCKGRPIELTAVGLERIMDRCTQ